MWRHAGNQSAESSDQQRETAKPLILIVLIGLESGAVIRIHYEKVDSSADSAGEHAAVHQGNVTRGALFEVGEGK